MPLIPPPQDWPVASAFERADEVTTYQRPILQWLVKHWHGHHVELVARESADLGDFEIDEFAMFRGRNLDRLSPGAIWVDARRITTATRRALSELQSSALEDQTESLNLPISQLRAMPPSLPLRLSIMRLPIMRLMALPVYRLKSLIRLRRSP